jgi:hypothetical protein
MAYVPRTDYASGSTITGWASFTTQVINYSVHGKIVFVEYNIVGTSNATSASFTVPAVYTPATDLGRAIGRAQDNSGAYADGMVAITAASATIAFYKDLNFGAFTASGTKAISGRFFYFI